MRVDYVGPRRIAPALPTIHVSLPLVQTPDIDGAAPDRDQLLPSQWIVASPVTQTSVELVPEMAKYDAQLSGTPGATLHAVPFQ